MDSGQSNHYYTLILPVIILYLDGKHRVKLEKFRAREEGLWQYMCESFVFNLLLWLPLLNGRVFDIMTVNLITSLVCLLSCLSVQNKVGHSPWNKVVWQWGSFFRDWGMEIKQLKLLTLKCSRSCLIKERGQRPGGGVGGGGRRPKKVLLSTINQLHKGFNN